MAQQMLVIIAQIEVNEPLKPYSGPLPPNATAGKPYAFQFGPVEGGTGPITWSVDPVSPLPPGLTLSPSGLLSGSWPSVGSYAIKFRASDVGN